MINNDSADVSPVERLVRPDCFEFAMDFLGGSEAKRIRAYVEALEAAQYVDAMASERTQHARWRQELADALVETEKIRDVLGRTLNKRENDLMMLRNATDAMMAPLGYHGTISARDDRVQAVMDALVQIDN